MQAKSIKGKLTEEIKTALEEVIATGFTPTLAIVFISIKQDREAITALLNKNNIAIFGASTSGEFIDGEIGEGTVAIMLLDMKPEYFKILFQDASDHNTLQNAIHLGKEGKRTFANPAFIIVSGWLQTEGEDIITGIEEGFGGEANVFGGMAGDDLELKAPFVFTNDKSSVSGVLSLIIDEDKIAVNGIATCGWQPIGTTKTVTKSVGNIVYTIDDKPALDMVMKYLGLDIDLESGKEVVTHIGAYYPLQLERENVAPVMRTAMFANREDHSLICAGTVPQGSKVRFSLPPDFDAIEKVVEECNEIKKEKQTDADAMIMFSCISRHLSFGLLMSEEIEQVQKVWDAPMAGFFCYGEFGKSKTGKHEFHNNTCCVVVLKEK
ncbi:MAG: FIST N-terminal domain-containing protein [Ferruginibacter sp.]